ncbi:MAG TPA: hypothetical protein VFN67_06550, partial [Polyangiales bacterium]|nr:hypothetical protein [Polyangiales bacterium]
MSRLSHLVFALTLIVPALRVAAQTAPAEPPPAAAPPAVAAPSTVPAQPPAAAPPVVAAPSTVPAQPPAAAAPPSQPAAPAEPLGMGEQPGGVIYGAGALPAEAYQAESSLPEWAQPQCPHGRCGPDCRQRCNRDEFCSEYNTCELIPERVGQEHKGLLLRVTSGYGFGSLSASDAGVREGSLVVGL